MTCGLSVCNAVKESRVYDRQPKTDYTIWQQCSQLGDFPVLNIYLPTFKFLVFLSKQTNLTTVSDVIGDFSAILVTDKKAPIILQVSLCSSGPLQ